MAAIVSTVPGMVDLVGQRFGRLSVVARAEPYVNLGREYPTWKCTCDCGNTAMVVQARLRSGKTTSCGCYKKTATRTHGHASGGRCSPTYNTWQDMIDRCSDANDQAWGNYGGRGIRVCERWLTFANFLADMGERAPGMTIDRIDNDGNYEPGNCRWTTRVEQNRNTRAVKLSPEAAREIRASVGKTAAQLAREHNVSKAAIKAVRAGRLWRDV